MERNFTNLSDFGYFRVSAVSPELRVANVHFNVEQILQSLKLLDEKSVQIAVFPELCLTGYTCGDLFFQENLLAEVKKGLKKTCRRIFQIQFNIYCGFPFAS